MMSSEALNISVDKDFQYLQLEPFLRSEVQSLLQISPARSKVSFALERQSHGAEATIHFSHPTKIFNIRGDGNTPLIAAEHALNRLESAISSWMETKGYCYSSLTTSLWTNSPNTEASTTILLQQLGLSATYKLKLNDICLSEKIARTDVFFCEWPQGSGVLQILEEQFLSGRGLKETSSTPKPVVLLFSNSSDNFKFHRSPWFFPLGTIAISQKPPDSVQRLEKYLDFVLRNRSTY